MDATNPVVKNKSINYLVSFYLYPYFTDKMKITRKNWKYDVAPGSEGMVNVTPEDGDDIWALYNLISEGDEVECFTMRKVLQENSSGDVVDSQKIKIILAVRVEKVDVDLCAPALRVNGRNVKENKHVKLGSYHTLDIETGRWLKLTKSSWDALSVEILEQAVNSAGRADVGAIVMQDGLAHVCIITPSTGIKILQRVEVSMPKNKKFAATSQAEKAMGKFINACIEAMREHVRFDALKAIIVAGVDKLPEELYKRLLEVAQNEGDKSITENKSKFVRLNVSSGQPSSLEEALKEPRIAAILADTKTAKEAKMLDRYYQMDGNGSERTTFGPTHVQKAAEQCAIKQLLLSDALFRSIKVEERRRYADLIEMVRDGGGEIMIFSTGSEPERRLQKLTGVAAILNFPVNQDL